MENEKIKWKKWDTFMFMLSIYVLIQLAIDAIARFPQPVNEIFDHIDFCICIIFLGDWLFFFIKATDKKKYFYSRIIDLISSIPFVAILRPFRIFRVARFLKALRLLRGLKGFSPILKLMLGNPARSALTIYSSLTTIIFFYCSIGIYNYEIGINKNMNNYGDALWLSFTTLTTVGYGDIYPITIEGRIFCVILIITGLGLFSLSTGEIAAKILKIVKRNGTEPPTPTETP
jgi:voltage-gated potassium channel